MNPLTCHEVEEQLDLRAAGEGDAVTRAAVDRHLADCPACAGLSAEARRLQGLLAWHGRAPAALERMQRNIDKEDRRMRQPRLVLPFVGRLAAAAALVLLTFGLLQTASDTARVAESEQVVGALVLRDEEAGPGGVQLPGGNEAVAAAKFHDQRLMNRDQSLPVTLDRHGKTAAEYRRDLKDAARADALPPPAINLALELSNPGAKERTLYLSIEEANLALDLRGPGDLRLSIPHGGLSAFVPQVARVAPGKSVELPIRRLSESGAGRTEYLYWTEPGEYTLKMRLRVPYSESGVAGRGFMTYESQPVRIKVVEPGH